MTVGELSERTDNPELCFRRPDSPLQALCRVTAKREREGQALRKNTKGGRELCRPVLRACREIFRRLPVLTPYPRTGSGPVPLWLLRVLGAFVVPSTLRSLPHRSTFASNTAVFSIHLPNRLFLLTRSPVPDTIRPVPAHSFRSLFRPCSNRYPSPWSRPSQRYRDRSYRRPEPRGAMHSPAVRTVW